MAVLHLVPVTYAAEYSFQPAKLTARFPSKVIGKPVNFTGRVAYTKDSPQLRVRTKAQMIYGRIIGKAF